MSDLNAFKEKLPAMRQWIEDTLDEYSDKAIKVGDIKSEKIRKIFPMDILSRAKVVIVDKPVPVPPLSSKWNLKGLAEIETKDLVGITYKDTFFINSRYILSEEFYFHELVHVLQWDQLGVDNFLLAYGAGVMKSCYRDCPLEEMAYFMQEEFNSGLLNTYVDELIREKTDRIWNDFMPLLSAAPD